MEDLMFYIRLTLIVILGIDIAMLININRKLKRAIKELAEKNRFRFNKIDRLERETILSHEALLRAKEQILKQQQNGQRQDNNI